MSSAHLPNGCSSRHRRTDGVGENPEPLAIVATVTHRRAMTIDIDFEGIGRAGRRPRSIAGSRCRTSPSLCAIRCSVGRISRTARAPSRPITVRAPGGLLWLTPRYPAACGARGVVGYRASTRSCRRWPRWFRTGDRRLRGRALSARRRRHEGRSFVLNEMVVGTWGRAPGKDGIEGISNPAANLSNQPVEMIETDDARRGAALRPRDLIPADRGSFVAASPSSASSASSPPRALRAARRSARPSASVSRAAGDRCAVVRIFS